jgi:hypothetical protein
LFHSPTKHRIVHRPQAHRTPLDLQTVYVEKTICRARTGGRGSAQQVEAGGQATGEASEGRTVRATQRSRFGHFEKRISVPALLAAKTIAVDAGGATCWPAPQTGRSELLRPARGGHISGGLHLEDSKGHWPRFAVAYRSSPQMARQADNPCTDATCHRLVPSADLRVSARPSALQDGRSRRGDYWCLVSG